MRTRIDTLANDLLPSAQLALGNYGAEQVTRTQAFLVLAHATFESHLEKACREAVRNAEARLATTKQPGVVACALVSFFPPKSTSYPQQYSASTPSQKESLTIAQRLSASAKKYIESVVDENNGIKQHNLVRLLAPIGFSLDRLSPTFLVECDSLGARRGKLAHGGTQQVVDPLSEKAAVDQLLSFFEQLISDIRALQ